MKTISEFFDGPTATRIVDALKNCSANTIVGLWKKKMIRMSEDDFVLNYRSLKIKYISTYCKETGCSARYFFYGTDDFVFPAATDRDVEVISILDTLSEEQLDKIYFFIQMFFPNSFWDKNENKKEKPSQRLIDFFTGLPHGSISFVEGKSLRMQSVSDELMEEFQRFRAAGQSKYFKFNTNLWPELAEFAGVSLHWILDLDVPMFCSSQKGDLIFDRYTLMQPKEKKSFYFFLNQLNNKMECTKEREVQA